MAKKITVSQALAAISVISCCLVGPFAGAENISLNFRKSSCSAFLEEVPLRTVIEKVRKETGIWIRAPNFLMNERISVQFENLPIQQGLKRILRGMNYSFLFDQDSNLLGAFIFSKAHRIGEEIYSAELNEQMVTAAFEGNTAAVMDLLAKGADVNAGDIGLWSPLFYAVANKQLDMIKMLLQVF